MVYGTWLFAPLVMLVNVPHTQDDDGDCYSAAQEAEEAAPATGVVASDAPAPAADNATQANTAAAEDAPSAAAPAAVAARGTAGRGGRQGQGTGGKDSKAAAASAAPAAEAGGGEKAAAAPSMKRGRNAPPKVSYNTGTRLLFRHSVSACRKVCFSSGRNIEIRSPPLVQGCNTEPLSVFLVHADSSSDRHLPDRQAKGGGGRSLRQPQEGQALSV